MNACRRLRIKAALVLGILFTWVAAPHPGYLAFSQSVTDSAQEINRLAGQADFDLHSHKLAKAADEYRRILTLDPGNISAHSNLGLAYYLRGNYPQAAGEFEIALRGDPDLWNIVALCGISEAQSGHVTDAIVHLNQAFSKVRQPSLRMVIGKQLFSLFMEADDLDRAAHVIEELQELDPDNIDVLYAAHQIYSLLANQAFLSLAQLAPDSARMYELQGDEMAQVGNVPGAIAAYKLAIGLNPHLSGAHLALGEALSASHSPAEQAEAESEYRNALADNPGDERAECRLGDIELKHSKLQAATLDFQRVLKLQPDNPDANKGLGTALMESGSSQKAIAYLTRAVHADPFNESAYYHLSLARRNAGDMEGAARAMREFLKLKANRDKLEHNFSNLRNASARSAKQDETTLPGADPGKPRDRH